ncbi:hypothetical protein NADFUDRAFT_43404 [Nadsonia fulvescens var. elongata DSM 6958]|uniref:ER membrane protein complex subunit 10 n=1 Tax=Nadsonia fulvescens var. elongata DSM 6958 TaxID=857566 RepID=A0A1E3PHR7_9ASCO|nr:hypothetical protein NADFUDRAFT_43404 [Nadsonia fulvescens var. elongata DSM 6958]
MLLSFLTWNVIVLVTMVSAVTQYNMASLDQYQRSAVIYARPIDIEADKLIRLGIVTYNLADDTVSFTKNTSVTYQGLACVGVTVQDHDESIRCRSLSKISRDSQTLLNLYIDEKGAIANLDYLNAPETHVVLFKPARSIRPGPKPLLKEPMVLVGLKGPSGGQTAQEAPKSFIQKYWMFIVPGLLAYLIFTGGDNTPDSATVETVKK